MIDLRSDTVTQPSSEMKNAMNDAAVGDDMFGEDPTVNELERFAADLFGKEAALYCSSGTQTNQIAIKVHTSPGDEVICDRLAHVYLYEGGGIAMNSGASVRLLDGDRGRFTVDQLRQNINADDQHYPVSRLVCLEDSCNKGGGAIWDIEKIGEISAFCKKNALGMHLDGARLFNSLVETNYDKREYASHFDSISICLSKGLGAPIGSLLLGSKDFIGRARRVRKVFGGAMRQAGYIAAGGLYALKNNIDRLKTDNDRAKRIGSMLEQNPAVVKVLKVETNILVFELSSEDACTRVISALENKGILAFAIGSKQIRFVLHLDIKEADIDAIEQSLRSILSSRP